MESPRVRTTAFVRRLRQTEEAATTTGMPFLECLLMLFEENSPAIDRQTLFEYLMEEPGRKTFT